MNLAFGKGYPVKQSVVNTSVNAKITVMSDKSFYPIQNKLIDAARIGLITIAWLAALCTVMFGSAVQCLSEVGVYCFICCYLHPSTIAARQSDHSYGADSINTHAAADDTGP